MATNFTIQEILSDIKTLSYGDNTDKKAINKKYGYNISKKAELEQQLYYEANLIRKKENTENPTEDDFRVFNHNIKGLGTKKNAEEALKDESIAFVKALIEKKKQAVRKYGNSIAGRSYQRELKNIEEVLYNKEHATEIESKKSRLGEILFLLKTNPQIQEFQQLQVEKLISRCQNSFNWAKSLSKEEYKKLSKPSKAFYNYINIYSENFTDYNKYLDCEKESFIKTFLSNILSLADRLDRHGFQPGDNIEVLRVAEDPKFIEFSVKSPQGTFYCRSILAACDSYLVQTHYRFIITKK